jgi:hypothetical protein
MWATTAMPKRKIGKAKYQNTMPPVMRFLLEWVKKSDSGFGDQGFKRIS